MNIEIYSIRILVDRHQIEKFFALNSLFRLTQRRGSIMMYVMVYV